MASTLPALFALCRHGVVYRPIEADAWTNHVTRLADDDVVLDELELKDPVEAMGRIFRG